jgi:hypothetical protein
MQDPPIRPHGLLTLGRRRLLPLLNDPEVAIPPLLNLVTAPARRRCFQSLLTDCCGCHPFPVYHHLVSGNFSSEKPKTNP